MVVENHIIVIVVDAVKCWVIIKIHVHWIRGIKVEKGG